MAPSERDLADQVGRRLYEVYARARCWRANGGETMSQWDDLGPAELLRWRLVGLEARRMASAAAGRALRELMTP